MRRPFIVLLLVALLAACAPSTATVSPPRQPVTLTVFAAASLTDAFNEIKEGFEAAHPGVTVIYNFAGSNALAAQLGQGAPADVFASANNTQMNAAIEAGRVVSGTTRTFARNRLVVIVPTGNPGGVAALQDLARPGLKIVLAAAEVPVGQYSLDFLDKAVQDAAFGATFKDAVLANVASYEENVRSVLTKITLGEGDAGIVYTSDISGDATDQVERLDIPDALNTIASYPIGAIQDSAQAEMAQAFLDYVLAPEGQTVLASYGFIPVNP
jgi:molybdate transport system substrate-binding protein